jgi:hypothetical protein
MTPVVRQAALLVVLGIGCGRPGGCGEGCGARRGERLVDAREFGDAVIADGQWSIAVDEGGVLRVRFNHAEVAVGTLGFLGSSGPVATTIGPTTTDGDATRFSLEILPLRLHVAGRAWPEGDELLVEYRLDADAAQDDLEGGGLAFTLRSDARIFGAQAPAPTRLDDGHGFAWDTGRGALRFAFDDPGVRVEIDPVTDDVRCSFYRDELAKGSRTITLRISLPPGSAHGRGTWARLAAPDPTWHANTLPWDDVPVDLSFLNEDDRPAGRHGPVRIEGDALVRGDGVPLRLWGTNVAAYALFHADDATIAAQAHRLAAFGFNLVRIHHHDSAWVEPNVFGRRPADTRTLDDAALARIDRWIAALQAEGIYVWLDLEVGRTFTAADGIDAFEELERGRTHGAAYVNPSMAARMQEFARAYLGRDSSVTHRRVADDPGVAAVMLTNENDLTHHFGNLMGVDAGRPRHRAWLEQAVRGFSERTGVAVPDPLEPWRLGATKAALADVEAGFFRDATADLRALGYRGPIANTQVWGDDALYALPSLTSGDVVDVHSYGGPGTLSRNAHVDANLLHPIGASAVAGLPTTVSEWNIPAPARDRFVGPTLVGATAALQGWDAMMLYVYASMPLEAPTRLEIWSSWDDPAILAMMPAAALMFRRGDVAPARERYAIALDRATVFDRSSHAQNLATVRSLVEQSEIRVVLPSLPELPWLRGTTAPVDAVVLDDADRDHLEGSAVAIVSDTGELRRDWAAGIHTVTTARNVSATGAVGGRSLALGEVTVALDTPAAAIALSSLDGRPIASSQDLLLACVAQVAPSTGDRPPLRSEPVRGTIALRSTHAELSWQPLGSGAAGRPGHRTTAIDGVHRFALEGAPVHFWRVTPVAKTP